MGFHQMVSLRRIRPLRSAKIVPLLLFPICQLALFGQTVSTLDVSPHVTIPEGTSQDVVFTRAESDHKYLYSIIQNKLFVFALHPSLSLHAMLAPACSFAFVSPNDFYIVMDKELRYYPAKPWGPAFERALNFDVTVALVGWPIDRKYTYDAIAIVSDDNTLYFADLRTRKVSPVGKLEFKVSRIYLKDSTVFCVGDSFTVAYAKGEAPRRITSPEAIPELVIFSGNVKSVVEEIPSGDWDGTIRKFVKTIVAIQLP